MASHNQGWKKRLCYSYYRKNGQEITNSVRVCILMSTTVYQVNISQPPAQARVPSLLARWHTMAVSEAWVVKAPDLSCCQMFLSFDKLKYQMLCSWLFSVSLVRKNCFWFPENRQTTLIVNIKEHWQPNIQGFYFHNKTAFFGLK